MPPRNSKSIQPFQGQHIYSNSLGRRLLRIPVVRAIVLLSAVFLACVLYGKFNFYRDPGSIFYDESRAFERRYSAVREGQAVEYIRKMEKMYPEHYTPGKPPNSPYNSTICVAFMSTLRPGVDPYLDVSLASALDRLTPAERRSIYLSVFFATTKPVHHDTFHRTWLRKVVDEVYTYEDFLAPSEMDHVRDLENAHDGLRKAPYDYTIPLRHCFDNSRAKYIAIFEDDIILAESWLARTLLGLREMEAKMRAEKRRGEWLYLRLFNQERSTGWGSKSIGGNNEALISLAVAAGASLFMLLLRRRSRRLRAALDEPTILVTCLLFVPLFVVLFFQAGKASMLPPRPGIREEPFGCCAQGLVFNRHHAEHLAEYLLQRRHEGYTDMITRDYARVFELARWSQYPMMIQHVGTRSSIQTDATESQKVWSMAFESLDEKQLAREHKHMLSQLFGDTDPESFKRDI